MESDIQKKLDEHDLKLDAIFISVEKTRKYFLIMTWITVIMFVLPLIALMFIVPSFLSSYTNGIDGLNSLEGLL